MKIGFIGLGNMGAPMAINLVRGNHLVAGYDPVAQIPEGVVATNTPVEAAMGADVVITMLPSGAILRTIATAVLPMMEPGAVLLDCSTVDVATAGDVAVLAEAAGCLSLDAPVSGGVTGAAAGTLTFMVGGSDEAFKKASHLFELMGQKSVLCGPSGSGQAAKLCNNMILGATMFATAEAFNLADKLGLDRQAMFDVVSTSSGASWSMNTYCPAPGIGPKSPADDDYRPGFASELMLKDLRLAQDAARAVGADTPIGRRTRDLYAQFVEAEGGAGKDFSAILPWLEKKYRT